MFSGIGNIPWRGHVPASRTGREPMPDALTVTEAIVRDALRDVADPATGKDVITAGLVEGVEARGGLVQVTLLTDRARAPAMEPLRQAVERRLASVPGVRNVAVVLTTRAAPPAPAPAPPGPNRAPLLADVGAVIAVASGKGGVGKSTVAVNLAVALARSGLRVGLLDADIHGPSQPTMLGLSAKPEVADGRMVPLDAFGLKAISMGLLVDPDTAMIWRGPMVMGALTQLMGEVAWGPLDVMVLDLPPGTGDIPLTLAQRTTLKGALIVSTPQDVALIDARRAVAMFRKVGVPILGLIENMSFFCCPNCGHRSEIFGHGGGRTEASRLDVDFLGEVPLQAAVRISGDAGTPIVVAEPDSEAARAFVAIAAAVKARL